MKKLDKKVKLKSLITLLEKYTNKKVSLTEKSNNMPDFLKHDNLFNPKNWEEEPGTITKPKPKEPMTKPGTTPDKKPNRSPLSPEKPVVKPRPKANK